MNASIFRTEKKKRGRPKTDATSIHLTLQPDLLAWVDAFRQDREPPVSRPEAIRQALEMLRMKANV